MKVFLCEKPSQAQDIAAVLGAGKSTQSTPGYIEIGDIAVTWCIGHLYEQASPEEYDPALKKWDLKQLPITPKSWQMKPRQNGKVGMQISAIRKLLKQADEVVIATDPDREGEVIGREVLDELIYRGPVSRLIFSALDPASIRKALAAIRPGRETESLYYAGLGRARADWLVGMNLTRAWTIVGQQSGARGVLSVGRVQTPTLNLVVQRDLAIENFVAREYYVVEAVCPASDADDSGMGYGKFRAVWTPDPEQLERYCDSEGRCLDFECAVDIASALSGSDGIVTASSRKPGKESPPLPFSLSQLQQFASSRWGYGAQQTLEIAQALYEKHKAISYPRTDTGYLPEDQHAEATVVCQALRQTFSAAGDRIIQVMDGADLSLKSPAWNDRKVTAHHGMIPTTQPARLDAMSGEERNVFMEIAFRYVLQFWPDHEYVATKLTIEVAGNTLKANGREPVKMGWKELTARKQNADSDSDATADEEEFGPVPFIPEGGQVLVSQADILEKKTKPPAPYTEGTLIKAMTNIASEVTDPEMKKLLREHDGIGTEATRAGIIQTLKEREFIETVEKKLRSTETGRGLIAALPDEVKDPSGTALMERKLAEVEAGTLSLDDYLEEQVRHVSGLVHAAREKQSAMPRRRSTSSGGSVPESRDEPESYGTCPECGKALRQKTGKYGLFIGCSGYPECSFIKRDGKRSADGKHNPGSRPGDRKPQAVVRNDVQCPECGKPMVERKSTKGSFYGCSRFPKCRGTRKVGSIPS